jgi:nitroimidazol reductase NimA-like FMN-containing flavoprotein (pyridoxamine 5'-phosphate oxidase superfamily)
MTSELHPHSERVTVKRLPKRAAYDRETIDAILDEALNCHVGFVVDGQPFAIPTIHARAGDTLFIHGSAASRMLRGLRSGIPVCVTVTLVDGLVLARSAFHQSMNYRSVVIVGKAAEVTDPAEKYAALKAVVDHVVPGRWDHVRWPTEPELKATSVLALPIVEASAKVRTGGPLDDEEDYALPVWAGIIPLALTPREVIADSRLLPGIPAPDYATSYRRR